MSAATVTHFGFLAAPPAAADADLPGDQPGATGYLATAVRQLFKAVATIPGFDATGASFLDFLAPGAVMTTALFEGTGPAPPTSRTWTEV
ncbi:MAG TPA: hypothetical protein VLW50_03115 [Streptosporangiaceae bacterium]|nr:hypothetical protein [Streptosporangiaceae bacterium]